MRALTAAHDTCAAGVRLLASSLALLAHRIVRGPFHGGFTRRMRLVPSSVGWFGPMRNGRRWAVGSRGRIMALSDVSNILWRERQLLELLVFKLEEEQLVLAAGRSRWLAYATREVENVLAEIKRMELERAVQVADAGRALGLSGSPTLRELSSLTPAPWGGIFA